MVNPYTCNHKKTIPLLKRRAMKKIKGGNIRWCLECGTIKHTDLDGKERWAYPHKRD